MIQIEIDDKSVLSALQILRESAADLSPAMARIAVALASESERQFNAKPAQVVRGPTGRTRPRGFERRRKGSSPRARGTRNL